MEINLHSIVCFKINHSKIGLEFMPNPVETFLEQLFQFFNICYHDASATETEMKRWMRQAASVIPLKKRKGFFFRTEVVRVPFNTDKPQMFHTDHFYSILPKLYLLSPDWDVDETLPPCKMGK
ncbi:MAG: hypothetical protein Q9P14_09405 [candidate division KSB1 bacterium]|nr:hypothetical protein [candidate division KSB1 bacterium]MDQ7065695.1 hypothetical protein [candidate division KSB1 bacterium]